MSLMIRSIGTATPQQSIRQEDAAELAAGFCCANSEQQRMLPILYRRTAVRRRYSVLLETADSPLESLAPTLRPSGLPFAESCATQTLVQPRQTFYPPAVDHEDRGPTTRQRMEVYELHAGRLATEAASQAIQRSGLLADSITHLITVSCTGFSSPGVDVAIVRDLGLPADVARTHIGFMGCHGAMNAIRVAQSFAEADPRSRILVCAVELCSLHHQYGWEPDRIVSNALFADGAAAMVVSGLTAGVERELGVVASGSTIVPVTEDLMSWSIGDHGYEMTLSPIVPEVIRQSLRCWLAQWLLRHGCRIEDVGGWAIHPGGPRILQATADAIGLADDDLASSRTVLRDYGNMSSPTVLFVVQELLRCQVPRPYVMLGFGPGLTIEAALLT